MLHLSVQLLLSHKCPIFIFNFCSKADLDNILLQFGYFIFLINAILIFILTCHNIFANFDLATWIKFLTKTNMQSSKLNGSMFPE